MMPHVITLVSTAYCDRGTVAISTPSHPVYAGPGIVAVDPRVFALRSFLLVNGVRKWAADTGGNIRGLGTLSPGGHAGMDIWMSSCSEALRWGRRVVRVTLLDIPNRYPKGWTRTIASAPVKKRKSFSLRIGRAQHRAAFSHASRSIKRVRQSSRASVARFRIFSAALLLTFILIAHTLRDLLPITKCKRCGKWTRKPKRYLRLRQPQN